ncbi:peroxisomal bifunctional enzyme-like [Glandiceps talaboti]
MAGYHKEGSVAVITLKNPPVNALSHHVRSAVVDGIQKAESDRNVSSVVICGHGDVFCAGADIKEFKTGEFFQDPGLTDVIHCIEDCNKPVVAAIKGLAFGGGLEVALGCHYRIGDEKARVSFPEGQIGLLPAATGTQRLPRVAGIASALDIIVTGRHVSAKEAHRIGILDKLTSGDVVKNAIQLAQSVAKQPVAPRRVKNMPVKDTEYADLLFTEIRKRVMQKACGAIAPMHCVRAVEAAVKSPSYMEGLLVEGELALQLMTGGQAAALQYAFFAERKAQKWELPGGKITYKSAKPLPMKTAAVIGCGTMGNGIAMSFIDNNIPIYLLELNQQLLDRGMDRIRYVYQSSVEKGRISEETAKKRLALITPTLDYNSFKDVDVVVEVVYENMELKKKVFAKLDSVCKPSAVLCSNTSVLNIDEIASTTKRPDKVIGTHFFVPAHRMKMLETVRGKQTSPETIATAMTMGKTLGKIPVLVGNCYAFVANRMFNCRNFESLFLVEEGCLPEEVDSVMEDYGFPFGPFKVFDMISADTSWRIREEAGLVGKNAPPGVPPRYRNGQRYCPIPDMMFEKGLLGQKAGKGYYRYERPGDYKTTTNPDMKDMLVMYCREHGIQRRKIPYQEIMERLLYSAINEGFRILEDGIATRMEDIDTIWIYAYGWPRHTGGPMYYATKMVGLPKVYERICYYQSKHPDIMHWQPSELMKKMVAKETSAAL